jgi:transglutaminase-like putative cysteine protease
MGGNSSFGAPDSFTWDRWIRGHFKYRPEAVEVVRTPSFMLDELERTRFFEGDCDCVSVFYGTVIKTLGYRVRFVAIRYSDPTEFQHVFLEYHNGSRWVRVDPTTPPGTIHVEIERMVENI